MTVGKKIVEKILKSLEDSNFNADYPDALDNLKYYKQDMINDADKVIASSKKKRKKNTKVSWYTKSPHWEDQKSQ
jgi:hypothetical protein